MLCTMNFVFKTIYAVHIMHTSDRQKKKLGCFFDCLKFQQKSIPKIVWSSQANENLKDRKRCVKLNLLSLSLVFSLFYKHRFFNCCGVHRTRCSCSQAKVLLCFAFTAACTHTAWRFFLLYFRKEQSKMLFYSPPLTLP